MPKERSSKSRATGAAGIWLHGIRVSWFAFVMLGIIILGVFVLSPTVRSYFVERSQVQALQKANDAQKAQIAALDKLAQEWHDPNFIEAQARTRLMYVKPGQTSYLIVNDTAAQAPSVAASSAQPEKQHGDWASSLLDSIVTASTTEASSTASSGAGAKIGSGAATTPPTPGATATPAASPTSSAK